MRCSFKRESFDIRADFDSSAADWGRLLGFSSLEINHSIALSDLRFIHLINKRLFKVTLLMKDLKPENGIMSSFTHPYITFIFILNTKARMNVKFFQSLFSVTCKNCVIWVVYITIFIQLWRIQYEHSIYFMTLG